MNSVSLIGRITRDPELRTSVNGKQFVGFTIAVNRIGQQNQTDFISCFAWGKTAENMTHYVKKGMLLGIEGSLASNTNNNVTSHFVNAIRVQFLENKNKQNNNSVSFDMGNNSNMSNNNGNDNMNNNTNGSTNNTNNTNKTTQNKNSSESDDFVFDDDEFEIKWD